MRALPNTKTELLKLMQSAPEFAESQRESIDLDDLSSLQRPFINTNAGGLKELVELTQMIKAGNKSLAYQKACALFKSDSSPRLILDGLKVYVASYSDPEAWEMLGDQLLVMQQSHQALDAYFRSEQD
jgi:hypothetical protein